MPTDLTAWIAERRSRCHDDATTIQLPAGRFLLVIDLIEAQSDLIERLQSSARRDWDGDKVDAAVSRLLDGR